MCVRGMERYACVCIYVCMCSACELGGWDCFMERPPWLAKYYSVVQLCNQGTVRKA